MTKPLNFAAFAVLLIALTPGAGFAQDTPKTGVLMASNGAFALTFRASDRMAIRPEISFNTQTASSKTAGGKQTLRTTVFGIGAVLYAANIDSLRTYFSPRYTYQQAHSESSSTFGSSSSSNGAHTVSGSFGAEYSLHRRFAAFGEVGVTYGHAESSSTKINSWGNRAVAGAIVYF